MTKAEATNMLKAKLECLTRETSGTDFDCNNRNCDDCSLCYEQGNIGEQKEALDMAIQALEQEPCKDAVSRTEITDELNRLGRNAFKDDTDYDNFFAFLDSLPSVTPTNTKCIATVKFSKEDMQELVNEKMKEIVVERKKGKWIKVDTNMYTCSNCSHCFTIVPEDNQIQEFKYCPNCGVKIDKRTLKYADQNTMMSAT